MDWRQKNRKDRLKTNIDQRQKRNCRQMRTCDQNLMERSVVRCEKRREKKKIPNSLLQDILCAFDSLPVSNPATFKKEEVYEFFYIP